MDEEQANRIRERAAARRDRRIRQIRNARSKPKSRKGDDPIIVVMTPEEGLTLLNAYSNPKKSKKKKGNEDDEVVNANAMSDNAPILQ